MDRQVNLVEFWKDDKVLVSVWGGSIVPRIGEFISIRKQKYKVIYVSYAVDYADKMYETQLRANVQCEEEV